MIVGMEGVGHHLLERVINEGGVPDLYEEYAPLVYLDPNYKDSDVNDIPNLNYTRMDQELRALCAGTSNGWKRQKTTLGGIENGHECAGKTILSGADSFPMMNFKEHLHPDLSTILLLAGKIGMRVKFIFLQRDPRLAIQSANRRFQGGRASTKGLYTFWQLLLHMQSAYDRLPAEQAHFVKFRDICEKPEGFLHGLANFLELDEEHRAKFNSVDIHDICSEAHANKYAIESHIQSFFDEREWQCPDMCQI
jgi:hypothetical protein